jgi:hypothetical protein
MTQSPQSKNFLIDIHEVLGPRREVAVVSCIPDVQALNPYLNDKQAREVLKECRQRQDCQSGFDWLFVEMVTDELFPELYDNMDTK